MRLKKLPKLSEMGLSVSKLIDGEKGGESVWGMTCRVGGVAPQSTYIYRIQSSVWRLPNY
jgi:hypothetical protein